MGGLATLGALLATLFTCEVQRPVSGPWTELFGELARLESLAPDSREFRALAGRLDAQARLHEAAGKKSQDNIEKYRARVILYHVRRLQGRPATLATEPDAILEWLPHEAWYATRALRPGLYRVETAVAALDETPALDSERASWAARLFDEERGRLEFDLAQRVALGLYRRAPDPLNVDRLARLYVWRGDGAAARSVASEALLTAGERSVQSRLRLTRARVARALGDERAALADYGAALAFENAEAALDLASEATGRTSCARASTCARLALETGGGQDEAWTYLGLAWIASVATPPSAGAPSAVEDATLFPPPSDHPNPGPYRN